MRNAVNDADSALVRNMLVAARDYVGSARILHEAGDPAAPEVASLHTIMLLTGLAVELAFKSMIVKSGAAPAAVRYSVGPGLRRAAELARSWGYVGPAPGTANLLDLIALPYLNAATRRYDDALDVTAFDVAEILAWTEDLIADVEGQQDRDYSRPLPRFLAEAL